jgi:glycine/D-amino acid oxidase-like deaminating enzyme
MKQYENVIIGAGIAGCSIAHFLQDEEVLLIDRNEDVAFGASGAAGAFLSPLLGKNNGFKNLIAQALRFSVSFYKQLFPEYTDDCGVIRIPKNNDEQKKFESYIPYMDFEFIKKEQGYFFPIGARVNPYAICKALSQNAQKKFNYEIEHIEYIGGSWLLNKQIKTKKLFITTGADTSLIKEKYFSIRAVWGQKIDIATSNCIKVNYHKECSLSTSSEINKDNVYKLSIGATHRRFDCDTHICNHCLKTANINKMYSSGYTKSIMNTDTQELIAKAQQIMPLDVKEVIDIKIGARACSIDYFPMVGELIDSNKTMEAFPYLKNGTPVKEERFITFPQLYVLNGVGGRGFVLAPYLAKQLIEAVKNNQKLDEDIVLNRLFKRWVRKQK